MNLVVLAILVPLLIFTVGGAILAAYLPPRGVVPVRQLEKDL